MPGQEAGHRRFDFTDFAVDFERGELLRAGQKIRLRPKTLFVLEHFVRHTGRLVSRDELMGAAWAHTVVTEDSVTQCVAEIRKALGDDRKAVLRTISRRGYIFDARCAEPAAGLAAVEQAAAREPVRTQRLPKSVPALLAAIAFLAIGALGASQGPDERSRVSAGVLPPPAAAEASNRESGELQRLGRHLFLRRGPGDLESAERHLERAVRLDPDSASAWTTLAAVYAARGMEDKRDRMYRIAERRAALERALALEPTRAEAQLRMGRLLVDLGQHEAAQRAFTAAAAHGADDPTVLSTRSTQELLAGRLDEALALKRRAVQREPLSAVYRHNYGRLLLALGAAAEARDQLGMALLLNPQWADLHAEIARSLWLLGNAEAARGALRNVPEGASRDQLSVLLGSGTDAAAAESRLRARPAWTSLILLAEIATHRGEVDEAFAHLHEALQRWASDRAMAGSATPFLVELATSPVLRSLQDDERWRQLLARIEARAA